MAKTLSFIAISTLIWSTSAVGAQPSNSGPGLSPTKPRETRSGESSGPAPEALDVILTLKRVSATPTIRLLADGCGSIDSSHDDRYYRVDICSRPLGAGAFALEAKYKVGVGKSSGESKFSFVAKRGAKWTNSGGGDPLHDVEVMVK